MTQKDKNAYYDWKEMKSLKKEGFNLYEIARMMKKNISYLLSLESYFD